VAEIILKPLTALSADAPLVEQIGPWTITERADVALASVAIRRGREAEVRAAAAKAGLPLPGPARAEAAAVYGAFWMTPEMWMIEAPFATHADIRTALRGVFGEAASITEQTDAWVRFDLAGVGLERLFERLSNVDLARAPDGFAARTAIDHLGCYLIRRAAGQVTLYGPRSSAESLHHAVTVAARSVL
jgi:sarcosine oxidase subunit gamma